MELKLKMRLDKYVSLAAESRRDAKKILQHARVSVNGQTVKDGGFIIDKDKDVVCLDGFPLVCNEFIYIMMNKPKGVISATFDARHKTVIDLLPTQMQRYSPFPVGRLDIDTEGLLLLTNDGRLAHYLLSPRHKILKKYEAVVNGSIEPHHIQKFADGIILDDGYKTMPALLSVTEAGDNPKVEITICEGKFHQVKRMLADIDRKVLSLKRTEFAGLTLDEILLSGKIRELLPAEIQKLKNIMQ